MADEGRFQGLYQQIHRTICRNILHSKSLAVLIYARSVPIRTSQKSKMACLCCGGPVLTRPKLFLDLVGMGDHSHSAIHPAAHQMASAGSLAEEQQVLVQAPLAHSPMLKYFASSPLLVQKKLSTKRPASNGSIGTEISG